MRAFDVWRAVARRAILLLIAGAIINIASAWGCSFFLLPRYEGPDVIATRDWPARLVPDYADQPVYVGARWRGFGVDEVEVQFLNQINCDNAPGFRLPSAVTNYVQTPREWAESLGEQLDEIYYDYNRVADPVTALAIRQDLHGWLDAPTLHVSAGWPLRCVEGWAPPSPSTLASTEGVVAVDFRDGRAIAVVRTLGSTRIVRTLPYNPRWRAFAANTIVFALILWVLCVGPRALRRRIRVRRGLCPACAYPVGRSPVCTECGAELPRYGNDVAFGPDRL